MWQILHFNCLLSDIYYIAIYSIYIAIYSSLMASFHIIDLLRMYQICITNSMLQDIYPYLSIWALVVHSTIYLSIFIFILHYLRISWTSPSKGLRNSIFLLSIFLCQWHFKISQTVILIVKFIPKMRKSF